jgi:uncharacterized membrane protein (UPF0127 family)
MPSNETGKTKSARKLLASLVIASVITLICCIAFFTRSTQDTLTVNDHTYHLQVVSTETAMEKGLGGREYMPSGEGMLFDMGRNMEQCYWMKGMRFPLDIIWVNDDYQVTHIERSLEPASYPKRYCGDGRYVIELNAGQSDVAGIKLGQSLRF